MPTQAAISLLSQADFHNWVRNYSVEETLPTGESIRVRAARPDDRERVLDHLQHLSQASLRSRFFAVKENFTEQLVQLAGTDFANLIVLLATIQSARDEPVAGLATYALLAPASSVAELAITVADAYHDHGIGSLLLEHLTRIARAAGVAVLEASALTQNRAALAVLAHHGFSAESYEDPNVVRFRRKLIDTASER